jgi:hypothetical protein
METSREMGAGKKVGSWTEVRRAVGGSMDIVRAPGTAWARGGGLKEKGESLEVSGRGMEIVLFEGA